MARSYVELAEATEELAEKLRAGDVDRVAAMNGIADEARRLLTGFHGELLTKLAVWHVDYFYRLLHRVSFLDDASFRVVHALGTSLCRALADGGTAMAYLVDNGLPHDRLNPAEPFFSAMGFMVASPELVARKLAETDGVAVDDLCGPHLARYTDEATHVAVGIFKAAVERRRSFVWLSGVTEFLVYQKLGELLDGTGYIGVFRNHEPRDGSTVQIFQDSRGRVAIDPNY